MAHRDQGVFCIQVNNKFNSHFIGRDVLDAGSLDINGNNRFLFKDCNYTGIDVGEGNNVDVVTSIHEHKGSYDTIISTEAFEHDMYYPASLLNIVEMLRPSGLFLFTCATTGRPEHGTRKTEPSAAPLLDAHGEWGDYYKNLTEHDIREVLHIEKIFSEFSFEIGGSNKDDLYFYGIKKERDFREVGPYDNWMDG